MSEFTIVDYVWIGGHNELRSKTRVIYDRVTNINQIPVWNYDGSSTDQATGSSSEVFIHPRKLFKCPFRRPNGLIVMCDTYKPNGEPLPTNHRYHANNIFQKYSDEKPWYGLEQEYFIFDGQMQMPVGFNPNGQQGQYYCSVGGNNCFGRVMTDLHLEACLYAGIHISGTNTEVAPGQHEFQIGPVEGIDAADQLWIARYILEKISEDHGKYIVYDPKPLKGDWNGSGCHTNFSTESMRSDGGYDVIIAVMDKLKNKHHEHMEIYGSNNRDRMSGQHETSSYDEFNYGIASRKASVRIPSETVENKKGYFEDRRPAANIDPYQVTAKILETIME
ncbi:glutamine synthetase [Acanthamoeba polyphaga mimivirus]|uniref:glutamine synthetase n=4 Tax=Megamimivirinae TaxID=3044648 RepID=A0A2L2DJT4_MIMIV|nr:putative glutamine synthetase [Megavirus chiliensis]AEQ33367.1 glutamine synthetase [Megavirus chiliensis]AGD92631.1 putative glutamine synthetase [Megavirus lba]AVG46407.1 glutamine synthetase [Acanthamoeba polyphaga mimivirus]AVG47520.1 glutamine synthetase [Acanthamoeba polyphaga mimivirus]